MARRASVRLLALALAFGCGQPSPSALSIEDWCLAMERSERDRQTICGCPGDPASDAELEARCAALPALTLLEAFDRGDVGWNGAVAAAWARPRAGCDAIALGTDDPVVGSVAPGEPCRVFADTWGALDDRAYGARCIAPSGGGEAVCATIVGEAESCDASHVCDAAFACDSGSSTCTSAPHPSVCASR